MQILIILFQRCLLKPIYFNCVDDIFLSQVYRPMLLKKSFVFLFLQNTATGIISMQIRSHLKTTLFCCCDVRLMKVVSHFPG